MGYLVPGARALLRRFKARGLVLILLSGTYEEDVRREVAILGLAEFFGERIYGAGVGGVFSKRVVMERLQLEERVHGSQFWRLGMGPLRLKRSRLWGAWGLAWQVTRSEMVPTSWTQ